MQDSLEYLKVIAKPNCFAVLKALLVEELGTTAELAACTGLTRQQVQAALQELQRVGLVRRERGQPPPIILLDPDRLWELFVAIAEFNRVRALAQAGAAREAQQLAEEMERQLAEEEKPAPATSRPKANLRLVRDDAS